MKRFFKAVVNLFTPRARWFVPATIPCPHCGDAMQKGRVFLVERFSFSPFSRRGNPAWTAALFEEPNGNEVQVFSGGKAPLAYRCGGCASVFLTTPETVGLKIERAQETAALGDPNRLA